MTQSLLNRLCAAAISLFAVPAAMAAADSYPSKPIRVIVPFGPGGVADVTARTVSQGLSERLGQSIIVENKPGAGGISAATQFIRSAADGHTLFIVNNQNAVSPGLFKELPYDPLKDFAMISMVGAFDIVMAVDANSPLKSVGDVIEAAKKDPAAFNFATIGVGSTQHLSSEMFRASAGLEAPTVPFKSSGEVISALKGGNVQVLFETLPAVIGQIDGGGLRLLAVGASERSKRYPDVPTIAETVPGYASSSWNGFAAPAGTPPEIIAKLNKAIHEVVNDPTYHQKLVDIGMDPQVNTPEEFHAMVGEEIKKWGKVIDDAGIEKQ